MVSRTSGAAKQILPPRNLDALRIQEILGADFTVFEFEESTHTAAEAAAAIGCDVRQIAKSLIFTMRKSGQCVLVVASGGNRVDTKRIADICGERVRSADADFIREHTGFAPGGVSPVGFSTRPKAILDAELQAFDVIWAAAGSPNAVFSLTPTQLAALTGAEFTDIAKRD